MNLKPLGMVVLIWGTLLSSAAAQDTERRCAAYVASAVAQQSANVSGGCAFKGPRWTADGAAHLAWCRTFPQLIDSEERERAKLLRRCAEGLAGGSKRFACAHYASVAAAQAQSNAAAKCEMEGSRWTIGASAHFEWCLTQRPGVLDEETTARERDLALCFAKIDDFAAYAGDCLGFALRSAQQNEVNLAQRCGLQGRDWISDVPTLKGYCESEAPQTRVEILQSRQRQLAWCAGN
jgi:hypothetical protein